MARFFVSPQELQPDFLVLTGENAQHAKVLRLKNGEDVLVCDGQGNECLCTVSDVSDGQISLVVRHRQASEAEAAVKVSVYVAFPKADKLEHVIQKATELGAYEIVAFPSGREKPEEESGAVAEDCGFCSGAVGSWTYSGGFGAGKLRRSLEAGGSG